MNSSLKSSISRVGIIVIAAVMVGVISIIQYQRLRGLMEEEMSGRSHMAFTALADRIQYTLDKTELTMQENMWNVMRSMAHPDSVFSALAHLVDDNPDVVGGCLAFSPYYYPSKGRLFEPYVCKGPDGSLEVKQLAGPDHDYTQNEEYQWVLNHKEPNWTDPYSFESDTLTYATYSYPLMDTKGRILAICGLDIDLSWLGNLLNTRQPFASTFSFLLTPEGDFVTGPPESRTPRAEVELAVAIANGLLPASEHPDLLMRKTALHKDPYWQVVQVYKASEVFEKMKRMRHQQMLLILLGLAILAFMIHRYARNEQKLQKASEEQARISGELSVARRIQEEMLPKSFPADIYGSLEPAREVGGDLYDFYQRDGKLFFCIGDVSGKGVPSAMLMSVIHSLFRVLSQKTEDPSRILKVLNQELCRGNDSNMFVTFFAGCLDLYTGKLHYANAGHDKPYLLGDAPTQLAAKSNLPLGVFPDTEFEPQECTLSPGAMLFLYTDGLTEAKNSRREAFGRSRVQQVLTDCLANSRMTPESMVHSISDAAHRFAEDAPQSDDLTMLLIRYLPGELFKQQITLVNERSEVEKLGAFVKDFCSSLELDRKSSAHLRLALEEAVVNVINYAYPKGEKGSIDIYADSNRKEVRFTIVDSGVPFDPTAAISADTTLDAQNRPIGGLGILLTRKLADSVSYCRKGDKNVLTITKSIQ